MSQKQEKLLADLSDAIVDMDEARTEKLVQEYVQVGFDVYDGINRGLAEGMKRAEVSGRDTIRKYTSNDGHC